jgi:hypothetical protein
MDARLSSRQRWSGRQIALVAVAALPFAASLGFNSVPRVPRVAAGAPERPALVFLQYFADLREIYDAPRAEAYFSFKNLGKYPAVITNLEPSCGCLHPKLAKRAYMPGEECEFSLSVLTTHQTSGPHEYTLKIDYKDPEPRSVTVGFKLVVRGDVRVIPRSAEFWQNGLAATEKTFVVTDMRPKPFRVTTATCRSPLIKVKLEDPIDDPEGGRETNISITVAAQVPEKGVDTAVMLTTDDPRFPQIPIPIWIRDVNAKPVPKPSTRVAQPAQKGPSGPKPAVRQ